MRLKYKGRAEYAHFYGKAMALFFQRHMPLFEPDVLIPVPIHPSRYRKRGYNQAELIAREVSCMLSVPVDTGILYRRKKTKAQKELGRRARLRNLKDAFGVKDRCPYRRVLLIDDIFTTGSTIERISALLLENGASEIVALCAQRVVVTL